MVTWLPERSEHAVRDALAVVAPALRGHLVLHDSWVDTGNPLWSRGSAFLEDQWVVKFAWSEPAAVKLIREGAMIEVLGAVPDGPPVAPLLVRSDEPAIFVAPLQPGRPLAFEITGQLDGNEKERIGGELAGALAALHRPATLAGVAAIRPSLPPPTPQADTAELRDRLAPLLDERRVGVLLRWCDWVDEVLAADTEPVLLHGDFHGYNVIFDDTWRVVRVLDFEESSVGDHHYDFRYLPAQEPTVELLQHTVAAYQRLTGRTVDIRRVMAWHVRTVCGDALWRTEAHVALPGGGTPAMWIDELADRFTALSIDV